MKQFFTLLNNMCCSKCKSDFDNGSIKVIYKDKDYITANLICTKCGMDFGIVYFKITDNQTDNKKDIVLNDKRTLLPISKDDVLDAHKQIIDFEQNWNKFIND